MKSIHNKIVAIALAGIAAGGVVASSIKVYAIDYIIDSSSGRPVPIVPLNESFDPELYPKNYPVLDVPKEYIYKISDPKDVLPKGDDSGIDKIYRAVQGSGFKHIKVSGKRSVIDDFVKDMNVDILKKPQFCFKNIDKFREYILYLQQHEKPQEGVYRFMIGGHEGLFHFRPSKLLNMYDEVVINLRYIQRGEKDYKYRLLDFNLEGELILKKYKKPIELPSIQRFFDLMGDFNKRKVPGHFGSANHGGVQPGGIYCVKIGDLIFLFQALE